MITDPTGAYNSDTVAVAVNPGKDTTLSQISVTKKPKITTTTSRIRKLQRSIALRHKYR